MNAHPRDHDGKGAQCKSCIHEGECHGQRRRGLADSVYSCRIHAAIRYPNSATSAWIDAAASSALAS